jgi:cytidine deaminase
MHSGSVSNGESLVPVDRHQQLLDSAHGMMQQAYAPYSKFRVGCALLTEVGNIVTGCNVENASYGLTICAERAAIAAAVAVEGPVMRIRFIVVVNDGGVPCSPCGACRQAIFEFGPQAVVIFKGTDGLVELTAEKLLPAGFHL